MDSNMYSENSRAIVYIDGFNLYHGLKEKNWRKYLWLDLVKFSNYLIGENHLLVSVNYFTSKVKKSLEDPEKGIRQEQYLKAVRSLYPLVEITEGRYQSFQSYCKHCHSDLFCRNCGMPHIKPNEKKTDVNITTALFVDCFEHKCDCQILVSGDSDYENALKELRRLFPNNQLVIAFPPMRKNNKLIGTDKNTRWFVIPEDYFAQSQFCAEFAYKSKNGKTIIATKPTSWA